MCLIFFFVHLYSEIPNSFLNRLLRCGYTFYNFLHSHLTPLEKNIKKFCLNADFVIKLILSPIFMLLGAVWAVVDYLSVTKNSYVDGYKD